MGETPAAGDLEWVTAALRRAGCVAAREEAVELLAAARGDQLALSELVARRSAGEPLAWLVGSALLLRPEGVGLPGRVRAAAADRGARP